MINVRLSGRYKAYYRLTKPGIIYGNLLAAGAGFFLAAKGHIDGQLLAALLIGTGMVIASACTFNNYIDRGIDKKMARTRGRALASGMITPVNALIYGAILGVLGFLALALWTNWLTVAVGALGMVFYVVMYGIGKRRSSLGTVIGSIAGAAPPLAGYVAVTGRINMAAVLVFLILVFWQMPHFYAIAMYRLKDYQAAKLPVLPVSRGMRATKIQIMLYALAFLVAALLLGLLGYAGKVYLLVMAIIGLIWLWKGLKGFNAMDDTLWARKMFMFSLIVLMVTSVMLATGPILP